LRFHDDDVDNDVAFALKSLSVSNKLRICFKYAIEGGCGLWLGMKIEEEGDSFRV